MKFTRNDLLKEWISCLIGRLLDSEAAKNVRYAMVDDVPYLTRLWVNEEMHLILVSVKASDLLGDVNGEALLCAQIAHEIGHLTHMRKTNRRDFNSLEFETEAETEADKYALALLSKIFTYPEKILLQQLENALEATLTCGHASREQILIARLFAKARRANLLTLNTA